MDISDQILLEQVNFSLTKDLKLPKEQILQRYEQNCKEAYGSRRFESWCFVKECTHLLNAYNNFGIVSWIKHIICLSFKFSINFSFIRGEIENSLNCLFKGDKWQQYVKGVRIVKGYSKDQFVSALFRGLQNQEKKKLEPRQKKTVKCS